MATFTCPEAELHCTFITEAVDRIVATHDGLTVDELNWQPPAPDTNSVYVLAVHTIANVREAILQILGDQQIHRVRDEEFVARANGEWSPGQDWIAQKQEIVAAMQQFTCERMTDTVDHPRRGLESVREVLLSTSTHAREHTGHAELTRQLILAGRKSG